MHNPYLKCLILYSFSEKLQAPLPVEGDITLPLEEAALEPRLRNLPVVEDAPWWTYRHLTPSGPTQTAGDLLHMVLDAVMQSLAAVVSGVRKLEAQLAMDSSERSLVRERQASYHEMAELFFGGNNIANLMGQLIVANMVRPWEAWQIGDMIIHRLIRRDLVAEDVSQDESPEGTPTPTPRPTLPASTAMFYSTLECD